MSVRRFEHLDLEDVRIGGLLKNALIADLVMDDLGPRGDEILARPMNEPTAWTDHLARQLRMDIDYDGLAGLHETLLFVLIELENMLKRWPPRADSGWCKTVAHAATGGLTPIELYSTVLLGPAEWRRAKLGCTVERLPAHLRGVLEGALAAEIARVLSTWETWDVRKLRERRAKAIEAIERQEHEEREAQRLAERAPRPRTPRSDRPNPAAFFRPPPRV